MVHNLFAGIARYLRIYFLMAGQYVKIRLQYRFDFFVSTFGILLVNASAMLGLWIMLGSIPALAGWSYAELVFIYAMSLLAQSPLQIIFDNIWELRNHLNQGTFIKHCFKPIPTLFSYVSEMVDLKGFGQCIFGVASLVWASGKLALEWDAGKIILLVVLLLGSALLFIALMLLAVSLSFWIKDSNAVLAFVSDFRDHARYPMGIYGSVFRFIFTWIIPVGFIAYYPSQIFLRGSEALWTAWLSPILGVLLYAIAVRVWNRGVRAWGGTGS